jgi:hypothetical protein
MRLFSLRVSASPVTGVHVQTQASTGSRPYKDGVEGRVTQVPAKAQRGSTVTRSRKKQGRIFPGSVRAGQDWVDTSIPSCPPEL